MNKENVLVKIYELRDPRDLKCSPRYIGITVKKLEYRLSLHLNKKGLQIKTYKNNWIKSLLEENIKPTIHLIEEIQGWEYACKVEKYWIKEFKKQNYKLTNGTLGGEGGGGCGRIWTKESKEKASKTRIKLLLNGKLTIHRKPHSEEAKRKMSESHKGKVFSEEYRKNISIAKKGTVCQENKKLRQKENRSEPMIVKYDNGIIKEFSSGADCRKSLKIAEITYYKCLKSNGYLKKKKLTISFKNPRKRTSFKLNE